VTKPIRFVPSPSFFPDGEPMYRVETIILRIYRPYLYP